MGIVEIFLIAVGLAMDAFAASLAAGASPAVRGRRAYFRLAFHFGLFQALMPLVGWSLGVGLARFIAPLDHWVAFGLLAVVGSRMAVAGLAGAPEERSGDPTRGWTLVLLSVATSIDALAVGITLAMLRVGILGPTLVIGVVTAGLSLLGIRLGRLLGARLGRGMEIAGGLLLIAIGVRILVSHLGA